MENNLDKLFKSKLEGQEPEFNPAAWGRMEGLLEDVGMTPVAKTQNKSKRIYLFLLFCGLLLSSLGYLTVKSDSSIGEGSTLVDSMNANITEAKLDKKVIASGSKSNLNNETKSVGYTIQTTQNQSRNNTTKNNKSAGNSDSSNLIDENTQELKVLSNDQKIIDINKKIKNTGEAIPNKPSDLKENITSAEVNNTDQSELRSEIETIEKIASNDITIINNLGSQVTSESYSSAKPNAENSDRENQIKSNNTSIKEPQFRESIDFLSTLNTRTGILESPDLLIAPNVQRPKSSLFEIGLMASVRLNEGRGYSIGSYLAYSIGRGYSLNLGGQFDTQNFENGPTISVFDKEYSFGSKLSERKFILNNQKSLRLPLGLRKSFNNFSVTSSIILNKVFISEGNISDVGEGMGSEVSIDNEFIKSMTYSFQVGASVELTRFFDLEVGVEYRPRAFSSDPSISTNDSHYYPTIGVRYKLFKF